MNGHPILPTGYNSWDNNGDEVDGAGVNMAVWPVLFDTFIGLEFVIVTQAMIDMFDEECPDYVVACVNELIMIPAEPETLMIRGRR